LLGGTRGGLAMQRTLKLLGITSERLAELDRQALAASPHRVTVSTAEPDGLAISAIRDDVGPGEVWRAVVEAATADAVRLHESMSDIVGPPKRLIATGGWCHSEMVMHAKRAGLGSITVVNVAEPGTLGAATLAAQAAGALPIGERLGGRP
jgi:sugar (pentulose or hexulose) kinase